MLKRLAIVAVLVSGVLSGAQRPLPMRGDDNHQRAQQETSKSNPDASLLVASEVSKENSTNAERDAYYKTHPKEYVKAAFAPANLSNWILAILGFVGVVYGYFTLIAVKRQGEHIVASERAWMVATMKTDGNNFIFAPIEGIAPIGATCIFTNEGKTPAFILEIGGAIEAIAKGQSLPDKPPPYDPSNVAKWGSGGIPIFPKVSFMRFASKIIENPIEVSTGSKILWAYGYIKYQDALSGGKVREARYCFRFMPPVPAIGMNAQFLIEGPPGYNRAT